LAQSLLDLSLALRDEGKLDEALEKGLEGLKMFREMYGSEHDKTALAMMRVGIIYDHQGKLDLALRNFDEALEIQTRLQHPDIVGTISNRVAVYLRQGRLQEALMGFETTLAIERDMSDTGDWGDNSNIANAIMNIANVHLQLDMVDKALKGYKKALRIYKEKIEEEHPSVSVILNGMSAVYSRQQDHTKSLECIEESLRISRKRLGSEHPEIAREIHNRGVVCVGQKRYAEALLAFTEAKNMREKLFSQDHPDVGSGYSNIGDALSALGQYEEAHKNLDKALEIQRRVAGEGSLEVQLGTCSTTWRMRTGARAPTTSRGTCLLRLPRYSPVCSAPGAEHWKTLATLRASMLPPPT